MEADAARQQFQKIHARFATEPVGLDLIGGRILKQRGREVEILASGNAEALRQRLEWFSPEALTTEALTLEEIFVATLQTGNRVEPKPEAAAVGVVA
jgi:hypothetical protein